MTSPSQPPSSSPRSHEYEFQVVNRTYVIRSQTALSAERVNQITACAKTIITSLSEKQLHVKRIAGDSVTYIPPSQGAQEKAPEAVTEPLAAMESRYQLTEQKLSLLWQQTILASPSLPPLITEPAPTRSPLANEIFATLEKFPQTDAERINKNKEIGKQKGDLKKISESFVLDKKHSIEELHAAKKEILEQTRKSSSLNETDRIWLQSDWSDFFERCIQKRVFIEKASSPKQLAEAARSSLQTNSQLISLPLLLEWIEEAAKEKKIDMMQCAEHLEKAMQESPSENLPLLLSGMLEQAYTQLLKNQLPNASLFNVRGDGSCMLHACNAYLKKIEDPSSNATALSKEEETTLRLSLSEIFAQQMQSNQELREIFMGEFLSDDAAGLGSSLPNEILALKPHYLTNEDKEKYDFIRNGPTTDTDKKLISLFCDELKNLQSGPFKRMNAELELALLTYHYKRPIGIVEKDGSKQFRIHFRGRQFFTSLKDDPPLVLFFSPGHYQTYTKPFTFTS